MPQLISYGGVSLSTPSPAVAAAIGGRISPADVYEFQELTWPGGGAAGRMFPGKVPQRPIKIGSLFWPRGASRWAVGHFLATDSQLADIRPLVYGTTGLQWNALNLVLSDGTDAAATGSTPIRMRTVTAPMYMLPPRQLEKQIVRNALTNVPTDSPLNGLYLLTLVDERYLWWSKAAAIAVTGGTTTWAQLFASIASALGITITTDTIDADYLKPPADFTANYEYLPLLLDAVCASVGQKLVRLLDGTVKTQNPRTAIASVDDQLDTTGWRKLAGGQFALDPKDDFGNAITNDLMALVPASVTVTFPRTDDGVFTAATAYAVTTTLASRALTEYGAITGQPNRAKLFHSDAIAAFVSTSTTPTNATELAALAQQITTDWYLWQLGRLDWKWTGIVPWTPEGSHDHIEWTHVPWEVSTRVQRPEWNDLAEQLGHHGTNGSSPPGGGGSTIFPGCNLTLSSTGIIDVNRTVTRSVTFTSMSSHRRRRLKECIIFDTWNEQSFTIGLNRCGLPVTFVPGEIVPKFSLFDVCECNCGGPAPEPCVTICKCIQCSCGAPCVWLMSYPSDPDEGTVWTAFDCAGRATGFTKFNTPVIPLWWDAGCTWKSDPPFDGVTLTYTDKWRLSLRDPGGTTLFYVLIDSEDGTEFACCGWNRFVPDTVINPCSVVGKGPTQIVIDPGGQCGPCPDDCECEPGDCTWCDDAPAGWTVPVSGFTGACAVFNRTWKLLPSDPCAWREDVGTVSAQMELIAGEWRLTLEDETSDAVSTYVANPVKEGECCHGLTLTKYECSCPGGGGGGPGCVNCNDTPEKWVLTIAGATGCLAVFNGTWDVTYQGGCIWHGVGLNIRVGIAGDAGVTCQIEDASGRGANYLGTIAAKNCCTDVALTFNIYVNNGGNCGTVPASLTLQSSCGGGGDDGTCPDTIRALPYCCDDDIPAGDCDDCSLCPKPPAGDGSPKYWNLIETGGTDEGCCFNRPAATPLKLVRIDGSDCLWRTEDDVRIVSLFPFNGSWRVICQTKDGSARLRYDLIGAFRCCGTNRFRLNLAASTVPDGCKPAAGLQIQPPAEGCPCEGSGGGELPELCFHCTAVPAAWKLVVAGFTACTHLNATWILTYDGDCQWTAVVGDPTNQRWVLKMESSGTVFLWLYGRGGGDIIGSWEKALADWVCLGPNTLALATQTPDCTDWPTTLTVEKNT